MAIRSFKWCINALLVKMPACFTIQAAAFRFPVFGPEVDYGKTQRNWFSRPAEKRCNLVQYTGRHGTFLAIMPSYPLGTLMALMIKILSFKILASPIKAEVMRRKMTTYSRIDVWPFG